MRRRKILPALTLAALAPLAATACGGGGPDAAASAAPRPPQSPAASAAPPSPSAEPFGTGERSGPADGAAMTPPVIEDVRVGTREGHDRVTLTFAEGTPAYIAHLMDPLSHGGRGDVTPLPGEHSLKLVLVGMGPAAEVPATGTTPTVRAVEGLGVFEGELGAGIGVDTSDGAPPAFRVTTEADQLHVDIAHSAP
ncbi:hypothetical protein V1J52_17190 [Streptomyces sp. TRM 70351]|uniref:AMIN-like domain-containing (lipo)protein n=1 Tax=Streptomyces sp. TRM 70351 TaxID=3116552 RepID=UPI002E7ABB80|nr:hypothetical protein [Streptomyces sp. TRM 70351]MEE1929895.1 hypothetical protein [Streptomyces sp. TRM 70351]